MEETNTQIAWPSKLKIGAKSKKGILLSSFDGAGLVVSSKTTEEAFLVRVTISIVDTWNLLSLLSLGEFLWK